MPRVKLADEERHCFTLWRYEAKTGHWTMEKAPVYLIFGWDGERDRRSDCGRREGAKGQRNAAPFSYRAECPVSFTSTFCDASSPA
jgi:hypothetical protein